jgi:hypothetical protein
MDQNNPRRSNVTGYQHRRAHSFQHANIGSGPLGLTKNGLQGSAYGVSNPCEQPSVRSLLPGSDRETPYYHQDRMLETENAYGYAVKLYSADTKQNAQNSQPLITDEKPHQDHSSHGDAYTQRNV